MNDIYGTKTPIPYDCATPSLDVDGENEASSKNQPAAQKIAAGISRVKNTYFHTSSPRKIGAYTLTGREIGGSGQAVIAEATKDGEPGKIYAVKIYAKEGMRKDRLTEWENVMKRLMTINSPYVVTVYEYGVTEISGDPYAVTDYYEDGIVGQHIDRISLSDELLIDTYVNQLNEGLHAIHEAGIYHCDIKPFNLMYANKEKTRIVIIDFGIAVAAEENYKDYHVGKHQATPEYSAIEVTGDTPTISDKSDYYSLGVTLLLLGSHRDIFAEIKGVNQDVEKQRAEVRRRLSLGDFEIDSTVNPYFAALIEGLMNPDRRDRFDYAKVKRWVADHTCFGKYKPSFFEREC